MQFLEELLKPYMAAQAGKSFEMQDDPIYGSMFDLYNQPQQEPPQRGGGGPVDSSNILTMAQQLAARRGWTGDQWQALYDLGMKESGWNPKAANPTSTARGIPQAMMSVHFGKNWQNSPQAQRFLNNPKVQIKWMLDYISGRYGNPSKALNFHRSNNWY